MLKHSQLTQKILDRNYTILSQKTDQQYRYFLENSSPLSRQSFNILYRNYYILLERYFENKLPLEKYERKIQKALFLRILPFHHSRYAYGNLYTWRFSYFRLVVFPTLHLLTESQINAVLSMSLEMLNNPNSYFLDLVEQTYHSVLDLDHNSSVIQFVDHMNHDLVCHVNFSIVYDEFRWSILGSNHLWGIRNTAQNMFLFRVAEEMKHEFSEILGTDVQIIRG